MADLEDFGDSLSDMSEEELTELLRSIRLSRRTPAKTTKPKKAAKTKEPKMNLDNMSADMAAKLLEQLGGE